MPCHNLPSTQNDSRSVGDSPIPIVAATSTSSVLAKSGEPTLMDLWCQDTSSAAIIEYQEKQTLLADEKKAQRYAWWAPER